MPLIREVSTPAVVEAEIQRFENAVEQVRQGQMTEEEFRPFRLLHGTYGQRQPGVQMVRVRIPGGALTPEQLRALATSPKTMPASTATCWSGSVCPPERFRLPSLPVWPITPTPVWMPSPSK